MPSQLLGGQGDATHGTDVPTDAIPSLLFIGARSRRLDRHLCTRRRWCHAGATGALERALADQSVENKTGWRRLIDEPWVGAVIGLPLLALAELGHKGHAITPYGFGPGTALRRATRDA